MLKFSLAIFVFFCSLPGFAQVEKIDTDRPDQTESPYIVPRKWMQFEMGFLRERDKLSGGYRSTYFEYPTLLTKYGLGKRVELRLITGLASSSEEAANGTFTVSGLHNVQLGGKVNIAREKKMMPMISLIAHYDFARLRKWYRDSVDGVNFRFTIQKTLTPLVALGLNLGMEWERFGSPPAYIYTFAPGFNISEKWYAYIEAFGSIWKYESPENGIDGGIAYYISNDLKIDLSAGFGISKKAPDSYIAIGASFRFKTGK